MIKSKFRKILRSAFLRMLRDCRDEIEDLDLQFPSINQQLQTVILNQYRSNCDNKLNYGQILNTGFRCYSQFEEDGIILYILSVVGSRTRKVVEMCCGQGRECMAANLIINHGFKGFLFDGDENNVKRAKDFFGRHQECLLVKPEINSGWITTENVNDLLLSSGASGEVDLFSLDIDGNDYHIWEAIDVIQPRVCVFETHDIIPDGLSLTIPYDEKFFAMDKAEPEIDFRSVSLGAMVKLSRSKGYTLVAAHRHGFNAFFVRNDLMNGRLEEASIAQVQDNEWSRYGQSKRWPSVKDMPWVQV